MTTYRIEFKGDHEDLVIDADRVEDKYGKNVIFGHMHRVQNYTRRDLKGQEAGWCIGCLCTLDPHYDSFANWHQGFAVVNWRQVHGEWFFSVEQIRIHDGVAIWRDKVYQG